MSAETTKKRTVNIGTIGHVDHGKTTLTAAITISLHARFPDCNTAMGITQIDKAPEEAKRGITINSTTIQYQTPKTLFSHTDCPGHADFVKNMITGASSLDMAILVVSANDGAMPQTKEHILLASTVGIKYFAVFLNKSDLLDPKDKEDTLEVIKAEIEEEFTKRNIDLKNVLWFDGSALKALEGDVDARNVLADMICKIDDFLPNPVRDVDKPFLLSVGEELSITGRGTVVTGPVERGMLKLNEEVEIVRAGQANLKSVVTGIGMFKKDCQSCQAGDNCGLLLRGINKGEVGRGDVVVKPGSVTKHKLAKVEFYILTSKEGGRTTAFVKGYRPQFFIRTGDYTGTVEKMFKDSQPIEMVMPGDHCTIEVAFEKQIPFDVGTRVIAREGGKTIGQGKFVQILG